MSAQNLTLVNFRNYQNLEVEFSPAINIFFGENAQGKTNIIESIFLNAVGKSHRGGNDTDLIKLDETAAKIKLNYTKLNIPNTNEFIISRENRRRIIKNGKNTTVGNIIGSFNAVLFSPEDLMLIKGAPALRRKFLDREISQANPAYYHELCKFNRIVNQRNTLLKNIREKKADKDTLLPWDEQFAAGAAKIAAKRQAAVKKMAEFAAIAQDVISDHHEKLVLNYEVYGNNDNNPLNEYFYLQQLQERLNTDIIRGTTGIGPQHDDLTAYINGTVLKTYGSQGQQRTTVLSLKLAEMQFLYEETGEYPVLLLDDVMSELDSKRRESLAAFLREKKIQTIITATDKNFFAAWQDVFLWQVKNGTVHNMS